MLNLFIQQVFTECLLSVRHVLDAESTAETKVDKVLPSWSSHSNEGDKQNRELNDIISEKCYREKILREER